MIGIEARETRRALVRSISPEVFNRLPTRQKNILGKRYLDGENTPTIRELARDEGVTFQAISGAEARGLKRLQKPEKKIVFPMANTSIISGYPRLKPTKENIEFILREGSGLSNRVIGKRLGRSRLVIARWRRELGIPPRRPGRPRKNIV